MKTTYLLIISIAVLYSCTAPSSNTDEVTDKPIAEEQIRDELYQEVIEVHDIAMVKMQTIVNLKNLALKEADSLRELGDETAAERIEQLENSQIALEEANKSMMMWMRGFRPPADTISHDMAMDYLRSEQDKITEVNSRMDQAIEDAKSL